MGSERPVTSRPSTLLRLPRGAAGWSRLATGLVIVWSGVLAAAETRLDGPWAVRSLPVDAELVIEPAAMTEGEGTLFAIGCDAADGETLYLRWPAAPDVDTANLTVEVAVDGVSTAPLSMRMVAMVAHAPLPASSDLADLLARGREATVTADGRPVLTVGLEGSAAAIAGMRAACR